MNTHGRIGSDFEGAAGYRSLPQPGFVGLGVFSIQVRQLSSSVIAPLRATIAELLIETLITELRARYRIHSAH
jgi:hypothetical protein